MKTIIKKCFLPLLLFSAASAFCQVFAEPKLSFQQRQNTPRDKSYSWIFAMSPLMILNTSGATSSAPSPVVFSCGIGAKLRRDEKVSFEPRVSFFRNYYLWDGKKAAPAEVENRTATVFSFLIDLPAVYNFEKKGSHYFTAGGGLALLARYGILSNGVNASDKGGSGSASGDVEEINSYLTAANRIIYPELTGSWNYKISERLDAGFEARLYIPLGGSGLDSMMFAIGTRFMF